MYLEYACALNVSKCWREMRVTDHSQTPGPEVLNSYRLPATLPRPTRPTRPTRPCTSNDLQSTVLGTQVHSTGELGAHPPHLQSMKGAQREEVAWPRSKAVKGGNSFHNPRPCLWRVSGMGCWGAGGSVRGAGFQALLPPVCP